MRKYLFAAALTAPLAAAAALPFTFQSGQTISATEINANFRYLESLITGSSSGASGLQFKSGTFNYGPTPTTILTNSGSTPIELVEWIGPGSVAASLQCPSGQTNIALANTGRDLPLRFLPPGCSIGYAANPGGSANGLFYSVAYR